MWHDPGRRRGLVGVTQTWLSGGGQGHSLTRIIDELRHHGAERSSDDLTAVGDSVHLVEAVVTAAQAGGVEAMSNRNPETIGGLTVIEVPSRGEALEWAAKIAVACRCAQEVLEFGPDPEVDEMLRQAAR